MAQEDTLTEPLQPRSFTLLHSGTMSLIYTCQQMSHAQDLLGVNRNVGCLPRSTSRRFCKPSISVPRRRRHNHYHHSRWIIMLALGRQCRFPFSPRLQSSLFHINSFQGTYPLLIIAIPWSMLVPHNRCVSARKRTANGQLSLSRT
jgi:hypothetical protein